MNGRLIQRPPADVVIVFQDYSHALLQWRTVARNVAFGLEGKLPRSEINERVREALRLVRLDRHGDDYPWQLSGGMQQRVQIARALALRPAVLLMDEPFAALDAMTKAQLHDELHRLRDATGSSVVFVTHDIEEAVYLGDRVAVITGAPGALSERSRSICPSRATRLSQGRCPSSWSCATCSIRRSDTASMREQGRVVGRINWLGLATIALGFALWELLLRAGFAQYQNLPAPSAIAHGLVEITSSGQLLADTRHTLLSVLVGWTAALVLGVVAGLLLGASSTLRRYSLASIEVLRPMPGIAFAPVALLLFGFSLQMELMVIILPALWPVLINTMGAVLGVHARLFEVGRTFRLPRGGDPAKDHCCPRRCRVCSSAQG